jgi:hypothetical protein
VPREADPPDTYAAVFMRDPHRVKLSFVENGILSLELPYDSGTMLFRPAPQDDKM